MFSLACASCYLDFLGFSEGLSTVELVLCYIITLTFSAIETRQEFRFVLVIAESFDDFRYVINRKS